MGFKTCSWDFFEVSHGKGAPDGVGSFLKRTADKSVSSGHDIDTFEKLFHCINSHCPNVLIYKEVNLENKLINLFNDLKGYKIKPVPSILKCHSVHSDKKCHIRYSDLSCVCIGQCTCLFKNFCFSKHNL